MQHRCHVLIAKGRYHSLPLTAKPQIVLIAKADDLLLAGRNGLRKVRNQTLPRPLQDTDAGMLGCIATGELLGCIA